MPTSKFTEGKDMQLQGLTAIVTGGASGLGGATAARLADAIKTVGKEAQPHPLNVFRQTVEVNLIGTFNVISKFAARLSTAEPIGEERGVIVNTASVAALTDRSGSPPIPLRRAASSA
jgi:NAD(P)-dependent dehydrogenase (short-subunit alcohol dehydrogenase family)